MHTFAIALAIAGTSTAVVAAAPAPLVPYSGIALGGRARGAAFCDTTRRAVFVLLANAAPRTAITALAWSPDQSTLAIATGDGVELRAIAAP